MSSLSLTSGLIGFSFLLLSTAASLRRIAPRVFAIKEERLPNLYGDKDGVATAKTVAEYSTRTPKILICLLSVLGLAVSIALAVLGTLSRGDAFLENWINAASWVTKFS